MGELLIKPVVKKELDDKDSRILKFGVGNMQGWRIKNEDAHICQEIDKYHIFGVFDGHGGPEVALYVEKHFIEELKKNKNFKTNIKKCLEETFYKLDELLYTEEALKELISIRKEFKIKNELNLKTVLNDDEFRIYKFLMLDKYEKEIPFLTGCTACVCVVDSEKKKAYFANSGDSRAIIIKKNNEIKQITKDHKPDDANEKERIYNAEGCVNDNRVDGILNLSRTIGDLKYKNNKKFAVDKQKIICTPDLYEENLKDIQYIVIGCDGIYDCMSNDALGKYILNNIKNQPKISKVIESLMDKNVANDIYASDGIGGDNMTCIIVQMK